MNYPADIDPEFIPFLDRLNDIEGIETWACCCGHFKDPKRRCQAYITIRVTKSLDDVFKQLIPIYDKYQLVSFWVTLGKWDIYYPLVTIFYSASRFEDLTEDVVRALEDAE